MHASSCLIEPHRLLCVNACEGGRGGRRIDDKEAGRLLPASRTIVLRQGIFPLLFLPILQNNVMISFKQTYPSM